jgi:hypothetical protein
MRFLQFQRRIPSSVCAASELRLSSRPDSHVSPVDSIELLCKFVQSGCSSTSEGGRQSPSTVVLATHRAFQPFPDTHSAKPRSHGHVSLAIRQAIFTGLFSSMASNTIFKRQFYALLRPSDGKYGPDAYFDSEFGFIRLFPNAFRNEAPNGIRSCFLTAGWSSFGTDALGVTGRFLAWTLESEPDSTVEMSSDPQGSN